MKKSESLFRARRGQRLRIQEIFLIAGVFISEWFWQNTDMSEARAYQDPEYRRQRWERERIKYVGKPGHGWGLLQMMMNETMDNVLDRLKADMPYLPENHLYAYTYFVAGFNNSLTAHLAGLPSPEAASALKSHLRDEILMLHSPDKFEYLELLPTGSCRIGKEMLSLHNCIDAFYGKSKKNQNQGFAGGKARSPGAGQRLGQDQEGKQTGEIHRPE